VNLSELVRLARLAAAGNDAHLKQSAFALHVKALERRHGPHARSTVLRDVLSQLAAESRPRIDALPYPPKVLAFIRREFERIDNVQAKGEADYFGLSEHRLRCDYRIVCFSRIPVGSQHIEISGVPRSLFLRGGVRQALAFLRMLYQAGSTAPFYQSHMSHEITRFNFAKRSGPAARDEFFYDVAECLERNVEIRGVFGSSWLYDPRLDQVTPQLSFYRQNAIEKGAILFRYGATAGASTKALSQSPTRQRLWQSGKYIPTTYAVVLPRKTLLAWAKTQRLGQPSPRRRSAVQTPGPKRRSRLDRK
jgi:hypothetical protein